MERMTHLLAPQENSHLMSMLIDVLHQVDCALGAGLSAWDGRHFLQYLGMNQTNLSGKGLSPIKTRSTVMLSDLILPGKFIY